MSQNNTRYILLTYPIYICLSVLLILRRMAFSFLVAFHTPPLVVV